MIVVIGGKSHGKKNFIDKYNVDSNVVDKYHLLINEHSNLLDYTTKSIENLKDKIIIVDEVGLGIVPLEKQDRYNRDELGRVYQYLCSKASIVIRIWYGLPIYIKGTEDEFKQEISNYK